MSSREQETMSSDIDLSEFRRVFQEVIDSAVAYHADLSARGLSPHISPEEIRALFDEEFSGRGESGRALLADWGERVAPVLMDIGGLRGLFEKNLGLTLRLHNLVREHPDFEVLHEPTLYLYCFRYVPNELAERQGEAEVQTRLDRLNREIVEAIERSGLAQVVTTRIGGRVAIRMSICSHRTSEEDVDAKFEAIARWGRLLSLFSYVHKKKPAEMEELSCSSESSSLPTEVSAI